MPLGHLETLFRIQLLDRAGLIEEARSVWIATADLWLQHLPGASLDVFEGAGALPHAETSALFCRALERFLEGVAE